MKGLLLDTTAVIDWLRNRAGVRDWIEIRVREGSDLGIGPIAMAEVVAGLDPDRRQAVLSILEGLTWVPISSDASRTAGELFWKHERAGERIPLPDLLQAASALASGRAIVTSNVRHFPDVEAINPRDQ